MTGIDQTSEDADEEGSVQGVALALSGGGYRAMVFHAGAICRLNEVGLLPKLACVSSVSGGSLTAGALALSWPDLDFESDRAKNIAAFIARVRAVADVTIDVGAVIGGIFLPGDISDRVVQAYDAAGFRDKTLKDLPDDTRAGVPRFVINATNVQSAVLWRFSRDYMADWRVGRVDHPDVPLSRAIAASSAFPPILSPTTLTIDQAVEPYEDSDLGRPPFTQQAVLSDGGVYDNLGLETVKRYKTLLVSDAGQKIEADAAPRHEWASHAVRILDIVDNQVRSLRKRYLMKTYIRDEHNGCYWGIRTDASKYKVSTDPLQMATRDPTPLAAVPTRLEKLDRDLQNRLMNWGYAVCDAALRSHIDRVLQAHLGIAIADPTAFPFPGDY